MCSDKVEQDIVGRVSMFDYLRQKTVLASVVRSASSSKQAWMMTASSFSRPTFSRLVHESSREDDIPREEW